jgi:hypothetical protein
MKPPNAPAALPTMILDMSSTPVKTDLLLISHAACRSYGPATGKLSRACGGVFGPFDLLDQAEEFISRFPIALGRFPDLSLPLHLSLLADNSNAADLLVSPLS